MENNHNNKDDGGGIGIGNGGQHALQLEQQQQEQEQEQEQERQQKLSSVISILEKRDKFPLLNRNEIDELVDEFLDRIGNSVHDLLCNNNDDDDDDDDDEDDEDDEDDDDDDDDDDYCGLDSDRDTEAEVETAIRFFPEILSRKRVDAFDGEEDYPIHYLLYIHGNNKFLCNLKAVSFIPLILRLAIEFGAFANEMRGGLLCEDNGGKNVLQYLMSISHPDYGANHNQLVDETFLQVLIQLRQMGCFKIEDICNFDLLNILCKKKIFAQKRFQFLSEWDPTVLLHLSRYDGSLPLHYVARSIQKFQVVFETGIRYYPKKEGINLLFRKNNHTKTPLQLACSPKSRRDEVVKVVEKTLADYCSAADGDDGDDGPYNIVDALLSAAIDEKVHLDGVYFLLRREPDVLQNLLPFLAGTSSDSNDAIMNEINSK
jgi:hypothetical protein